MSAATWLAGAGVAAVVVAPLSIVLLLTPSVGSASCGPVAGSGPGGTFTQPEIAALWTSEHGNPDRAQLASAVAMAESMGRPNITSPNPAGGLNLGLWQVWDGNPGATLDPAGNALAAIRLSDNGEDWHLWETYVTGAYVPYMAPFGAAAAPVVGCAPADASLDGLVREADRMIALDQPYVWGGGHADFDPDGPWDCSGAISQLLHALGLLDARPLTSGELEMWGELGRGKDFTVWANAGHVFLIVERGPHKGDAWGTATRDLEGKPGSGPLWHHHATAGFVPRHAKGH